MLFSELLLNVRMIAQVLVLSMNVEPDAKRRLLNALPIEQLTDKAAVQARKDAEFEALEARLAAKLPTGES